MSTTLERQTAVLKYTADTTAALFPAVIAALSALQEFEATQVHLLEPPHHS